MSSTWALASAMVLRVKVASLRSRDCKLWTGTPSCCICWPPCDALYRSSSAYRAGGWHALRARSQSRRTGNESRDDGFGNRSLCKFDHSWDERGLRERNLTAFPGERRQSGPMV
jgi:hypothetical protein